MFCYSQPRVLFCLDHKYIISRSWIISFGSTSQKLKNCCFRFDPDHLLGKNLRPQRCWRSKPGFVVISLTSGQIWVVHYEWSNMSGPIWVVQKANSGPFFFCVPSFVSLSVNTATWKCTRKVGHIIAGMVTTLASPGHGSQNLVMCQVRTWLSGGLRATFQSHNITASQNIKRACGRFCKQCTALHSN